MFASELKALLTAVGPELKIEPGAMVASMLYYWVPEQRARFRASASSPLAAGHVSIQTARMRRTPTGACKTWRARPPTVPPPI